MWINSFYAIFLFFLGVVFYLCKQIVIHRGGNCSCLLANIKLHLNPLMAYQESEGEDTVNKEGFYWSGMSVESILTHRHILFPCSGSALCGEIMCIIGDTNSGKTVLLDTITFNSDSSNLVRGVCNIIPDELFYIQDPNLFFIENFTVLENIQIAGNTPSSTVENHLLKFIKSHFSDDSNTMPQKLPLYKKHLLSLLLAAIINKPIIIFDNPFSDLEPDHIDIVLDLLYLLKSINKCIIITCNLASLTTSILNKVDKLYCIAYKRLIYDGTPEAVMSYFRNDSSFAHQFHHIEDDAEYLKNIFSMTPAFFETSAEYNRRFIYITSFWHDLAYRHTIKPQTISSYYSSYKIINNIYFLYTLIATIVTKVGIAKWLLTLIAPEIFFYIAWKIYYTFNHISIEIPEIISLDTYNFMDDSANKIELKDIQSIFHQIRFYPSILQFNTSVYKLLCFAVDQIVFKLFLFKVIFINQFHYSTYYLRNQLKNGIQFGNILSISCIKQIIWITRLPNFTVEFYGNTLLVYTLISPMIKITTAQGMFAVLWVIVTFIDEWILVSRNLSTLGRLMFKIVFVWGSISIAVTIFPSLKQFLINIFIISYYYNNYYVVGRIIAIIFFFTILRLI